MRDRGWTATEVNWLKAAGLVVGSVVLFAAFHAAEGWWGQGAGTDRLLTRAVENSMRCVALPHFIIAFLFMTTSRRMRGVAWAWLGGLAVAGVGLCLLFHEAGRDRAHIPAALFGLYFLVHEFRDEVFFYRANGDAPEGLDADALRREVRVVPLALLFGGLAVTFCLGAFRIGRVQDFTEPFFGLLPDPIRWVLGAGALVAFGGHVARLVLRARRRQEGGVAGFFSKHRPIVVVFGGILLIFLLDMALFEKVRSIVILHVTAWYVFTMYQFSKRPAPEPAPRPFTWSWIRATPKGFAFFHIGLFVLITLGCVVWEYGFGNDPEQVGFQVVLSREAFGYWTIMHITLSFVPR